MARDVDDVMERVTGYLDKHPGLLKNVSAGLAFTGLVFIGRGVRMLSWFRHATDVPAGFVRGGVRLRGRVCSASEGNLILEHLPIISFRKRTGQLTNGEEGLHVRLAGVDLTHDGKVWLESQLHPGDLVWFRLYERQGETLHCSVTRPKGWLFRKCLNEEVLERGFARVTSLPGSSSRRINIWRLYRNLLRAELRAQRRRQGLWARPDVWGRIWVTGRQVVSGTWPRSIGGGWWSPLRSVGTWFRRMRKSD
uniref:protein C3orf33 homolog isoform X2 n=1 Tax=Myxine glutinosa TaxID=7769 RepID=UPI00358EEC0A